MHTFAYNCYSQAQTIEDVKNQLSALDKELKGSDMQNLIAFNHTYYIITRNVYKKIGRGYFQDDALMRKIDTCFGNYYFEALHNYAQGNNCAPAWKILFDACKKDETFQCIYMALGVNAHVNNDLPHTLNDVVDDHTSKVDYDKINEIIAHSLPEVIESLQEKNKVLKDTQTIFKGLYSHYLNYTIRIWRNEAWVHFEKLQNKHIQTNIIEQKAQKKAQILVNIRHISQIVDILKVS